MKGPRSTQLVRMWLAAAALLGGGTVLNTCSSRVGNALKVSAKCEAYAVLGVIRTECLDPSDFIISPVQEETGILFPLLGL